MLRPPSLRDFDAWARLRRESQAFLTPWEPSWSRDHLSLRAFRNRVAWAERSIRQGEAVPLFLVRRADGQILGGITLSNIRRQPAQAATLGYWTGEAHVRSGYMTEALGAMRDYAFGALDLSRLEAACLPDNVASRRPPGAVQLQVRGGGAGLFADRGAVAEPCALCRAPGRPARAGRGGLSPPARTPGAPAARPPAHPARRGTGRAGRRGGAQAEPPVDRSAGSTPSLAMALSHLLSWAGPKSRARSASQWSQPLACISASSWPGAQPA